MLLASIAHSQETVAGRCVGVTDGDTIKVLVVDQQLLRVRLAFIDCPESRQAFGSRAKQTMSALVYGREVKLRPRTPDRYERQIALVDKVLSWLRRSVSGRVSLLC